jgi:hypothetical protein
LIFCCNKFKEEYDLYLESGYQDGIGPSKYDEYYHFIFEGCLVGFPLIYCPNCGQKLEKLDEKN